MSGELSNLNESLKDLNYIIVHDCPITCNLDSLRIGKETTSFVVEVESVTGDYFTFLYNHSGANDIICTGSFTYSTKEWAGKKYTNVGGADFTCVNLDSFLNDFQEVDNTTNGSITMLGTRTTASDAAISTLQGKGFTVTVPAATDAASVMTMAANSVENFGIAYQGKTLIVEPVDLSQQQIYPAEGVTVMKFATREEAEAYIKENGLEYHPE